MDVLAWREFHFGSNTKGSARPTIITKPKAMRDKVSTGWKESTDRCEVRVGDAPETPSTFSGTVQYLPVCVEHMETIVNG